MPPFFFYQASHFLQRAQGQSGRTLCPPDRSPFKPKSEPRAPDSNHVRSNGESLHPSCLPSFLPSLTFLPSPSFLYLPSFLPSPSFLLFFFGPTPIFFPPSFSSVSPFPPCALTERACSAHRHECFTCIGGSGAFHRLCRGVRRNCVLRRSFLPRACCAPRHRTTGPCWCYGFQGKPGGGAACCTRSTIRAGQEGERRGCGIVVRITHGGIKGGLHLITPI
jgi:hypothetical protein